MSFPFVKPYYRIYICLFERSLLKNLIVQCETINDETFNHIIILLFTRPVDNLIRFVHIMKKISSLPDKSLTILLKKFDICTNHFCGFIFIVDNTNSPIKPLQPIVKGRAIFKLNTM